jgi:hypothetical protein
MRWPVSSSSPSRERQGEWAGHGGIHACLGLADSALASTCPTTGTSQSARRSARSTTSSSSATRSRRVCAAQARCEWSAWRQGVFRNRHRRISYGSFHGGARSVGLWRLVAHADPAGCATSGTASSRTWSSSARPCRVAVSEFGLPDEA